MNSVFLATESTEVTVKELNGVLSINREIRITFRVISSTYVNVHLVQQEVLRQREGLLSYVIKLTRIFALFTIVTTEEGGRIEIPFACYIGQVILEHDVLFFYRFNLSVSFKFGEFCSIGKRKSSIEIEKDGGPLLSLDLKRRFGDGRPRTFC